MKRLRVLAIVPAAGCGKRMGGGTRKPFVMLRGEPLVSYALRTLNSCAGIDGIIVAAEKPYVKRIKAIVKRFGISKLIGVVVGGRTRFDSVGNCLKAAASVFDIVLIHDAARPLIDKVTVERSIKAAERFGACVVAIPETDTVKLSDNNLFVKDTLDRDKIFRAQTPQAFKYGVIMKAYSAGSVVSATDDSSLAERLGCRVKILRGSYRNIKITTKEDLKIAEALL